MEFDLSAFDTLMEHYKEEPLHPDLVEHVREASIGQMVHHPFVVHLLFPRMEAQINRLYAQKMERYEQAIASKRFHTALFLYERPYRLDGLMDLREHGLLLQPKEYWKCVSAVWRDSENISQSYHDWLQLWAEAIPERQAAMDAADRKAFAKLPEMIPIWRGVPAEEGDELGMSWTTNKQQAVWFAKRFAERGDGIVYQARVAREHIVAYLVGRNEQEAVVMPDDLLDITVHG